MSWRKAISNPYPGVDPDGKSPGGIQIAGDVDAGRLLESGVHIGSFSGCLARNFDVGITCANTTETVLDLDSVRYDIGGYFSVASQAIILPKSGYFAIVSSFVSDAPFVGAWELKLPFSNQTWSVDGMGNAGNTPEAQIFAIGHGTAGDRLAPALSQASGSDQLVYPYLSIAYLGS